MCCLIYFNFMLLTNNNFITIYQSPEWISNLQPLRLQVLPRCTKVTINYSYTSNTKRIKMLKRVSIQYCSAEVHLSKVKENLFVHSSPLRGPMIYFTHLSKAWWYFSPTSLFLLTYRNTANFYYYASWFI